MKTLQGTYGTFTEIEDTQKYLYFGGYSTWFTNGTCRNDTVTCQVSKKMIRALGIERTESIIIEKAKGKYNDTNASRSRNFGYAKERTK